MIDIRTQRQARLNEAPSLLRGCAIQWNSIKALMIRELLARYGRENFGFLWLLLEPMILATGVTIVRLTLMGNEEHGLNFATMIITGYLPLTMWRHMTSQGSIRTLSRNANVFYHRRVSALDVTTTVLTLEFVGTTAAFAIIVAATITFGLVGPIEDIRAVVAGWLLMAAISAGAALLICALTEWSEAAERFIQPLQYLLLPIMGTFFLVDWLPTYGQQAAWYVPTVHCFEMIRRGFLGNQVDTTSEPWYVLAWAVVMMAAGLRLLEQAREKATFK